MPVDASIYGAFAQKPMSVQDFDTQNLLLQQHRQGIQQNALAIQESQQKLQQNQNVVAQRSALQQAIQSGQIDLSNPDHASRALSIAPDVAPGMLTSIGGYQKDQALVAKDTGAGANSVQEARTKALQLHQSALAMVKSPQDMATWMDGLYADPATKDIATQVGGTPDQAKARIPADPAQFQQFVQQNAMGMDKYVQNQTAMYGHNLTANTSLSNNAANVNKDLQVAGIQASTSKSNNAATIAKDYAVAGLNPDGTPGTANDSIVDAIGQYKVAPPNGMALRNPRMQQILADVTSKYPDFDSTQYGARQVAAKSFATGKDGQQIQAGNTALNHLDTLRQLAEAQNNGDIQKVNEVKNAIAKQFGGTAPANLQAAVTMVGPEISKAVIGTGGGQGDRDKVDSALKSLSNGNAAQQAGVLNTMEDLFGGRLTEAQRTYSRTTGRNDFSDTFLSPAAQAVLAKRTGTSSAPASSGWKYIGPAR